MIKHKGYNIVLEADGTYKVIFKNEILNFESIQEAKEYIDRLNSN